MCWKDLLWAYTSPNSTVPALSLSLIIRCIACSSMCSKFCWVCFKTEAKKSFVPKQETSSALKCPYYVKTWKSPKILSPPLLSILTCWSCCLPLYFSNLGGFFQKKAHCFAVLWDCRQCQCPGWVQPGWLKAGAPRDVPGGGQRGDTLPATAFSAQDAEGHDLPLWAGLSSCRALLETHIPLLLKGFFLMSIWFWVEKSSGQRKREYGSTF